MSVMSKYAGEITRMEQRDAARIDNAVIIDGILSTLGKNDKQILEQFITQNLTVDYEKKGKETSTVEQSNSFFERSSQIKMAGFGGEETPVTDWKDLDGE